MKQLEDKIIRNIYVMETRKMSVSFILKSLAVIFFGGAALLMTQVLWEFLSEDKTLDVLSIFNDDAEIVRKYFADVVTVIFQETPKTLLAAIIISFAVSLFLVLTFIFNFGKIKHKITALFRYWQNTN